MISNKKYHEIPALSHSLIVACRDKGALMAFKESAFNPNREEREPTDALVFGQLYHTLIAHQDIIENTDSYTSSLTICLNPTSKKPVDEGLKTVSVDDTTVIFIYDFGASRRNKAYGAVVEYLQQTNQWTDDAIVCNQTEFDQCIKMVKALYANPYYQAFMTQYELVGYETDIMFQFDNFDFKAKPDVLLKDSKTGNYFILDWKTTKEKTREQIQTCGQKMGYHIQSHLYINAVCQKYNVPASQVCMLFFMQNKECPEIIYVARFNKDSNMLADAECCQYARDFAWKLKKYQEGDQRAFIEDCGIIDFAYYEPKLLEQPE